MKRAATREREGERREEDQRTVFRPFLLLLFRSLCGSALPFNSASSPLIATASVNIKEARERER